MPSRNVIKEYAPDSYYHLYNRGVGKQDIFADAMDYHVLLSYLKSALGTKEGNSDKRRLNFCKELDLLAYCLMPNHFHFLVYQYQEKAIAKMMQSVMTAYVRYYNKRHGRVGTLFQGVYKGLLVSNDAHLIHLSRYIHLNPSELGYDFRTYEYSSLPYYLGDKQASWVKPERILSLHDNDCASYLDFLCSDDQDYHEILQGLTLPETR